MTTTSAETRLQLVRTWVRDTTELADASVLVAPFDGQRPTLPYATVQMVTPTQSRQHDEVRVLSTATDGTGTERTKAHRTATVDVNLYGLTLGIDDLAEWLRWSIQSPSVRATLRASGLQVLAISDPRDLSTLVDVRHERRIQLEVTIGWAATVDRSVAVIEAVEFTGEVRPGTTSAGALEFVVEAGEEVPPPDE
jgi:hypothetical protein